MDHKMDWRLSTPFLAAGLEFAIEASHFEALEDLGVGALGLAIAPGMSDGGKADLDVGRCAVLLE
jgi:hypothetical protein